MLIPTEEVLKFYAGIESGEITLTSEFEPQDIYAGNVEYRASNGWTLVIFNDCNEWDYVDSVADAQGRTRDFDDLWNDPKTCGWGPPDDETSWRIFGIPGYLDHRKEHWSGWQGKVLAW